MIGLTSLLQSSSPHLHYHEFELFKDIDTPSSVKGDLWGVEKRESPMSRGKLFHCKCSKKKDSREQRSESRHHKTPFITIDIHITKKHDGKLFHCKCSRKDSRGQRSESRHHKTPSITIDIHITMKHDGEEEEKKAATSPTGESIFTRGDITQEVFSAHDVCKASYKINNSQK
ncbi:hypothetical protein CEXT_514861 [Caerostris extrusa]|uniref:Uncharacterized protein n=1 Tax=Caerostris extrusa TaxID=172846 RepID=A0AAV4SK36_CAEEX|nr:hypothetical protein CEXT_514861 [Caerostris extrusa]